MNRIRTSFFLIILTAATCFFLIGAVNKWDVSGFVKPDALAVNSSVKPGIVIKDGVFPANINYRYADDEGIYYARYNNKKNISIYNTVSGQSGVFTASAISKNYIHGFAKYEDCFAWEEDNGTLKDSESISNIPDWAVYINKEGMITKVDEGKPLKRGEAFDKQIPPQELSMNGDYLVYKSYDIVPGTKENGIVIKLYDIKRNVTRVIFSLINIENVEVSSPNIYKNYIVWSAAKMKQGDKKSIQSAAMYLYNIKYNSYIKLTEEDKLINPIIWGDYIACISIGLKGPSIAVLNYKTGFKKDIAFSDYEVLPRKEILDYSVGDGYITWNNSLADSVNVYDIVNDNIIVLKRRSQTESKNNSLLNIKIYGKRILYTDHVFDKNSGKTLSETNKYVILK